MTTPVRPRLLVLRALGLGDLLAGVPALRALRRAHPDHEIVLAGPEELAPVVAATGAVDRLLPASAPGRAVPRTLDWTGPPPEIAVDLHGNGPSSHRLLAALGPLKLLAFAHPGTPEIDGPPWYPEEHERDRWCRLLSAYGIPADPADLLLRRPGEPSPAPGAAVVHVGAGYGAKEWPVERFAAVASALRAGGHRVVVTASIVERPRALAVADQAGLAPAAVLAGSTGLRELAALVADAALLVSGDTGVAHLASAYRTPSVVLFGPAPVEEWGPPEDGPHRALTVAALRRGDPFAADPDPALLGVTVADVLGAVAELTEPDVTALI
jgi:ADP-heptose:LPS heptosyltransferase